MKFVRGSPYYIGPFKGVPVKENGQFFLSVYDLPHLFSAHGEALVEHYGIIVVPQTGMHIQSIIVDKYIVMLQIMETEPLQDLALAKRVSVQLQLTDPDIRVRDRVVKKAEKEGFYIALDLGAVWLERALASA